MREEIAAAVVFVTRLIRQNGSLSKGKVDDFSSCLSAILVEKFKNHWYKDRPAKGQGFRCIRINPSEPIDPVLEKAASDAGLECTELLMPVEMTLWVDPEDVSCRFGEMHGSVSMYTLASSKDGNLETRAHVINIDEIMEKERERHNQMVNIVTTRSTNQPRSRQFSRGLYYGKGANFYSKHQHNANNNHHSHTTKNRSAKEEPQVNGKRVSPDHVNEVRQQFLDQVTSVAGKSASSSPVKEAPTKVKENTNTVVQGNRSGENSNKSTKPQSSGTASTGNEDKKMTGGTVNTKTKSTPVSSSSTTTSTSANSSTAPTSSAASPGAYNQGVKRATDITSKAKSSGAYPGNTATTTGNNHAHNKGSYHGNGNYQKSSYHGKGDNYHWTKGSSNGTGGAKHASKFH